MATINEAFLKAYGVKPPETGSTEITEEPVNPPAESPLTPEQLFTRLDTLRKTGARQAAPEPDSAPRVPPPHFGGTRASSANSLPASSEKKESLPTAMSGQMQEEASAQSADSFRPMLEVSRFAWPKICEPISRACGQTLGEIALQMQQQARSGEKIVGVAGTRRGEGRTTVLLALAQRLVKEGVQLVIVDADLEKPDLARALGIACQEGWDAVLRGDQPLMEVLIESLQDGAALLPARKVESKKPPALDEFQANISMGILKEHYDIVLVDTGPIAPESSGKPDWFTHRPWLEGLLLVEDVRVEHAAEREAVLRAVKKSPVRCWGSLRNFEPNSQPAV